VKATILIAVVLTAAVAGLRRAAAAMHASHLHDGGIQSALSA
jgi:hypothetical protein